MKRIIIFLAIAIGIMSCTKPIEIQEPEQELYEFLGTRASEPLESTVWEFNTGKEFNKYIAFRDGQASVFYGKTYENDEVVRFSPLYSNEYTYENKALRTSVSYPQYGETIFSEEVSIIKAKDAYTIDVNGEIYVFKTTDTDCIDSFEMTIIAIIGDWIGDDNKDPYPWE